MSAPLLPEPHTQGPEAEQAQAEYEAAVARRAEWAEDPIVKRICEINNCQPEDVTPAQRRAGKLLMFQEMYGAKSCAPLCRRMFIDRGVMKAGPTEKFLSGAEFREAERRVAAHFAIDEAVPAHVPGEITPTIDWDFQHTAEDGTVLRTKGSAVSISTPFRKSDHAVNVLSREEAGRMAHVELELLFEFFRRPTFDAPKLRECCYQLREFSNLRIRDRVEDGVKPRKWQPPENRDPVKRGPVDQKQKAKNRAARKAAKRSRR